MQEVVLGLLKYNDGKMPIEDVIMKIMRIILFYYLHKRTLLP